MSKVILGMTLSLDGFVNDAHGSVALLYPDLEALDQTELMQEWIRTTGAAVMGRRTFEMGNPDDYADGYEFQVPLFVVTHHPPEKMPKRNDKLFFTFVTDGIESAVTQAKAAAGDKNVVIVGGPEISQYILNARLADELQIGIMPVLLGSGQPFFGALDAAPVLLEKVRVIETGSRTELVFNLIK